MTEKKDEFYNDEIKVEVDPEEVDLDALLEEEAEEQPYVGEDFEREDFQLSRDEEDQLAHLLKKREQEDLIMKTYKSLENKPSEEQIAEWKAKFGDVYLVSLSEHENFLFRPLKRQEWTQLTAKIAKLPEAKKTEMIVMRGVIFPQLTQSNVAVLTAGAPDTIRNLILEASNFIEPERAVTLVRKL
jgi:hypothetical protein